MKRKNNNPSSAQLLKSFFQYLTTPFVSHTNVKVEVAIPNKVVNRFPTTFVYDHLEFFNPENYPAIHSVDDTIPYRPMEEAKSKSLYRSSEDKQGTRNPNSTIQMYPKNNLSVFSKKKDKNNGSWISKLRIKNGSN